MKSAETTGRVRCAIYTRVSTDQGLRSSGSGLAVMQPINLGSGEDPVLDLDRCDALSQFGQIVQRDHRLSKRWAIDRLAAVYQRRWLACVGIDFIFAAHVLSPIVMVATNRSRMYP